MMMCRRHMQTYVLRVAAQIDAVSACVLLCNILRETYIYSSRLAEFS